MILFYYLENIDLYNFHASLIPISNDWSSKTKCQQFCILQYKTYTNLRDIIKSLSRNNWLGFIEFYVDVATNL